MYFLTTCLLPYYALCRFHQLNYSQKKKKNYVTPQPTWKTGDWSDCSAVSNATSAADTPSSEADDNSSSEGSGDGGSDPGSCPLVSVRNVYCEQAVSKGMSAVVGNELCAEAEGDKPAAQRNCGEDETAETEEGESTEPKVCL